MDEIGRRIGEIADRALGRAGSVLTVLIVLTVVGLVGRGGWAQFPPSGDIDTVIGSGLGDGGPAIDAMVDPRGVAVCGTPGAPPDLYIADGQNNLVRKVDGVTGVVSTVAGTGTGGYGGDGGPAIYAQLWMPIDVACDAQGDLYIADFYNQRVRRIDSGGIITTVAGYGLPGYAGDGGLATQAALYFPRGVALDGQGNMYVADSSNNRVRKVDSSGVISTVAGTGISGYSGDNVLATASRLAAPFGVAIDSFGNLYIADTFNARIRKVDRQGLITTVAGTGVSGFAGDGSLAVAAQLNGPTRVAFDPFGNMVLLDTGNYRVRLVGASGTISTIAGNGSSGSTGDGGPATQAPLYSPYALAISLTDEIYVGVYSGQFPSPDNRVRTLSPSGAQYVINTFVGGSNGDGGPAINAIVDPHGMTSVGTGVPADLYIADSHHNAIRMVSGTTGLISTVAGNGTAGFSGDGGPATLARLNMPLQVTVDSRGNMWIVDTYNSRVRRVDPSGTITTFAGNGTFNYGGDGKDALQAALNYPYAAAVDAAGNVYIADFGNNRIRMVTPERVIMTYAGTGTWGYGGDGGPATQANINSPTDVVIGPDGALYFADYGDYVIRQVTPDGIIHTVAGTGWAGFSGDGGPAIYAELNFPLRLAFDLVGNMFISDSRNLRVRRVDASSGIISTVAGTGTCGTQGDGGPAVQANIYQASGLAADSGGHLYIAQSDSARVRVVSLPASPPTPTLPPPPTFTPTPTRTATSTPTTRRSATPTPLPTSTPTGTFTATPIPTSTSTSTPSRTPTWTATWTTTRTPTSTWTPTQTPTWTATNTRTPTWTPTNTGTPTSTPTWTPTSTRTPTWTRTPTPTWTRTRTPTWTPTSTRTPTWTLTWTPTITRTPTRTATRTPTNTATRTPTSTPSTATTLTPTRTPTPVPWQTPTSAPVPTATAVIGVAGQVHYFSNPSLPVGGAVVQLQDMAAGSGSTAAVTQTDSAGQFAFPGIGVANWEIQPQKTGDLGSAVDIIDAVYVLQVTTGLQTLTPPQYLACDVNGDGSVDIFDAVWILQYTVGLTTRFPVAQACSSDWAFMPDAADAPNQQIIQPQLGATCQPGAICFQPLIGNASDQNFSAVLFGDCNGSWQPSRFGDLTFSATTGASSQLRLGRRVTRHGRRIRIPLSVVGTGSFRGLSAQLRYDPTQLRGVSVHAVGAAREALMQVNTQVPGSLRLALASSRPVRNGVVIMLEFDTIHGRQPTRGAVRIQSAVAEN